jgi:hypothetical protein
MTNYFKNIKLNIDPVLLDHSMLKNEYYKIIKFEDINPEFISLLDSLNIYVSHGQSFYSKPNFIQRIHTDNSGGDSVRLNFIYGGKESKMNWYEVIENQEVTNNLSTHPLGTSYLLWAKSQVKLIESTELISANIVQVGIPHNTTNQNEYRLCISFPILDSVKRYRLTMEETCERFKNYC